jgi:hypothetical protein
MPDRGIKGIREDHVMSDSPGTPAPTADVDPLTVFDPARVACRAMQLRDIERQAGVRRTL